MKWVVRLVNSFDINYCWMFWPRDLPPLCHVVQLKLKRFQMAPSQQLSRCYQPKVLQAIAPKTVVVALRSS